MSGLFIVAALVAAAGYFGWSALAALRSGDVTPARRGLRRRPGHSRVVVVMLWGAGESAMPEAPALPNRDQPSAPPQTWNLSCIDPLESRAIEGYAMITMGIGVLAGIFYWLAWYKLAFWILIYAIVYGGLGALRGDNQAHLLRRDSAVTIAVLIPVTWHIGGLAGYF